MIGAKRTSGVQNPAKYCCLVAGLLFFSCASAIEAAPPPDAVRCLLVGGLLAATKGDEHARSAGRQIEFYYLGLLFEKYSAQALKNSLLREHKALTDATYDTEWRRCLTIVQAKLQTLSVIQENIIRNEK